MSDHNPKTMAKNLKWLCDFSGKSRAELAEEVADRICRTGRTAEAKTIYDKLTRWTSKGLRQIDGKSEDQMRHLLDLIGLPHLADNPEELWDEEPDWRSRIQYHFAVYAAERLIRTHSSWAWKDENRPLFDRIVQDTLDPTAIQYNFIQTLAKTKSLINQLGDRWQEFLEIAKQIGDDATSIAQIELYENGNRVSVIYQRIINLLDEEQQLKKEQPLEINQVVAEFKQHPELLESMKSVNPIFHATDADVFAFAHFCSAPRPNSYGVMRSMRRARTTTLSMSLCTSLQQAMGH